jgi:hypothetical protein
MRIYDLQAEDGNLRAFEVENTLLTRGRACRIVESIPGVVVVRRSRLFRDTDDFCEFTLAGETFMIEEPFGDNSRYWVGGKNKSQSFSLQQIRSAFERHKTWEFPLRFLVAASLAVAGWAALQWLTAFIAQDKCLDEGGRWNAGERACIGARK